MSNYIEHAKREFRAAGWIDDNGNYDDPMQESICEHVIALLRVFGEEGHSGNSAPYAVNLFKKLALFDPIVPLTGEDHEWVDVQEGLFQNNRCGRVFWENGVAYDIDGIVFYDWYKNEDGEMRKSYFTSSDSKVIITFPYTPKTEYKESHDS